MDRRETNSNCGRGGFLPTRVWAQEIGLLVRGKEHLWPVPGGPPCPPGSRFRLTGLGPTVLPRERGAGRGQMETGKALPFSPSFSLSLLRREYFYFIRSEREKSLVIRKTKEVIFFKTPESLCLLSWGHFLWQGRADWRKSLQNLLSVSGSEETVSKH